MKYNVLKITTIYAMLIACAALTMVACPDDGSMLQVLDKQAFGGYPPLPLVAAGNDYTIGIKADGTLWAWGKNYDGQLGTGDEDDRNVPTQVGDDTWKAVDAGGYLNRYTVGIKADGTLWAWGGNSSSHLGLGDGAKKKYTRPQQVGKATWKAVAVGEDHTVGIKADGTLWAWGSNYNGQLGNGTSGFADVDGNLKKETRPQKVGTDKWQAIASGNNYTVGIKADGTLWAWGKNEYGQLGNGKSGKYVQETRPQKIDADTWQVGADTWKAISAGLYHTVGIKNNGELWAWGKNEYGQLGLGDEANKQYTRPQKIGRYTWKAISAGGSYTVGIKNNGELWAWGENSSGQLGLGDEANKQYTRPQKVGTATWKAVAAGWKHTVGIKADGAFWAWGNKKTNLTVVIEAPTAP